MIVRDTELSADEEYEIARATTPQVDGIVIISDFGKQIAYRVGR